jgi:hypothetical protein
MQLPLPPLLLADVFEMLGGVVGVLALVMWVIRQIAAANQQAGPPRARPQAAPAGEPQAGAVGGQPVAQQADPLRNQVEEFLRRGGRGAPGNQAPAGQRRNAPGPVKEIEVLIRDDPAPAQRPSLSEPFRPVEQSKGQPRRLAEGPRPARAPRKESSRRTTVAEHVAESVSAHSRAVAEQAARLGQRIIEDDQQFDVQLKAKFDHTVGTLTGSAVAAAEQAAIAAAEASTPAAEIATLLSNPNGVRQAIVINEILRRPSERW